MNFTEIVNMVKSDLNLTQAVSIARIGGHVNRRYRKVMRRLGLNVFSRAEFDFDCLDGSQEQTVDANNDIVIERIVSIFYQIPFAPGDIPTRARALDEITYDEMRTVVPMDGDAPRRWAKKKMGSTEVTFLLDTIPSDLTIILECESVKSELSGNDEPEFFESFHELLVDGAKADELRKLEKPALARDFEVAFKEALDELALKAVLAAHMDVVQNKNASRRRCLNG